MGRTNFFLFPQCTSVARVILLSQQSKRKKGPSHISATPLFPIWFFTTGG